MVLLSEHGKVTTLEPRMSNFLGTVSKPIKPSQLLRALLGFASNKRKPKPGTAPSHALQAQDELLASRFPLRILLVEDNLVNQKVAGKMLENMGYRPDIVSDGSEAVESVKRQPYDVVLMDMQMPIMDGLTATEMIRGDLDVAHQPKIIAMTANAQVSDREKCFEAGMDDYISKPVRIEDVKEKLQKVGMKLNIS